MQIDFVKYQGAGNDFVVIDVRGLGDFALSDAQVAFLCDRRLGVGADGLMTLGCDSLGGDFFMRYWNCDGRESTMCGNGGRCISHFAHSLGLGVDGSLTFNAVDGWHSASMVSGSVVRLQMVDVRGYEKLGEGRWFLNTGSPHYVELVDDVDALDLASVAPSLRYEYDSNVNFVEASTGRMRTWERGVEGETLACGTGATAVAMVLFLEGARSGASVELTTRCDKLLVEFTPFEGGFVDVFLTGSATAVFSGRIELL